VEKARLGHIGNDDITRFARLFKDELTLENTSRAQLVNLCRFMGLAPYGGDNFLRFQVRTRCLRGWYAVSRYVASCVR
jgi:LETM1 and EF-hand domain-containing protein 1, mitochondrial